MRHVEQVMGTAVSIELADDRPAGELRALIADVCGWLHEVDARFSTYKPDSEVSRLQSALEASGLRFAPSLPTWSQQAALLARGDEEGFAALTATLVAARQRAGRS